jgi:hypothetical protein
MRVHMTAQLVAELEVLAVEMRRRGWIARAGVLNEAGDVMSLCAPIGAPDASHDARANFTGSIAQLALADVDGRAWLYVDLGATRWMARIESAQDAHRVAAWLTVELQKLGVTVERAAVAQE